MTVRANIQAVLLRAYQTANRRGWFDSRLAETIFQRSYFAYKRLVEDPFAKLVSAHGELFRGGDVIDVGANIGYTATLFARAVSAPHRVHAFEPEERNFRWLEHAIAGRNVVAHRAAVGAREGEIELWHNADHHGDHRIATDQQVAREATQRVPVTTIDAYLASRGWPAIAFVKIDVQGYEPEVLRGMVATIANNPSISVAVEFMPSALADPAGFLHELAAVLPRISILERDGQLRDADLATILATTERSELGYVDLVSRRS